MATAMARWQDFETELKAREASIVAMLPQHVTKARFVNSAIAAVKQTPDLLLATPRSLFTAITKSAQDGLLPDGREGVITVYKEKQKDNSWQHVASWNPMTYGLRKRARELDGLIVNAQIVYEHDRFVRLEGDDPRLEHEPAPLGTTRGAMIGAYAIIRSATHILHREVMDAEQIEAVRRQSKLPDGLMWKTFTTEAWRKTVIRRALKTVPCSEPLESIVRRDEDQFAFADEPTATRPRVVQGGRKPLPPTVGEIPLTPAEITALDAETVQPLTADEIPFGK
jgi:recombination protein RecT